MILFRKRVREVWRLEGEEVEVGKERKVEVEEKERKKRECVLGLQKSRVHFFLLQRWGARGRYKCARALRKR